MIAQFLTENLLLAALGAVCRPAACACGTRALVALSPANIPRVEMVGLDCARRSVPARHYAAYGVLVFGLAPAMHAAVANLSGALKEGGRGDSGGIRRNRLRGFLVASEFALAFMLLIGAGLMVRSFFALAIGRPGFNPHNVLSMVVSVAGTKEAEPNRRAIFYRQLLEQVRTLPGVKSAGGHQPSAAGG